MPAAWNIDVAGQPGQPAGIQGIQGPLGPSYVGTSGTNLPIAIGPVTLTTQSGLAYQVGTRARIASNGDPTQWMEGVVTAYSGTSLTLNVDLTSASAASQPSSILVPGGGQLTYVSSTQLKFGPYNGDRIKVNGIIYPIPVAGIAGLGTTGVFVNGVAGQNLAASTTYFVYVFNNGGTPTADFSTTPYANSTTTGNVGTFIKSGDDTRTLIGIVWIPSTIAFNDGSTLRGVRSWFNRKTLTLFTQQSWGPGGSATWTFTGGFFTWVAFASDTVVVTGSGYGYNNTGVNSAYIGIGIDTVSNIVGSYSMWVQTTAGGYWVPYSHLATYQVEGAHSAYIAYQANGGSAFGTSWLTGTVSQ